MSAIPAPSHIRSAMYSNIHVYEMAIRGTSVMIRKSDGFVNATQILRAAGLPKPARTKVLEKEVSRGVHEKVQGGYAGSQGTWIPLSSAIRLAQQYNVYSDCVELFSYDMASGTAELTSPPIKIKRNVVPRNYSTDNSSSPDHDRTGQVSSAVAPRQARSRNPRRGDDYEDDYSSSPGKKRRGPAIALKDDSISESMSSNHPDAGKVCQNCGVTETPQWRRGPSGKRTLCNACGVKWSSGRLHLPSNLGTSTFPYSLSESETNQGSDPKTSFEDVEVGSKAWKIQLDVSRMRSKLREVERCQKKAERLLKESRAADRDIDRCYREILKCAKKAGARVVGPSVDNLFFHHEDEIDGEIRDTRVDYGDMTSTDLFHEKHAISRFIESVKSD